MCRNSIFVENKDKKEITIPVDLLNWYYETNKDLATIMWNDDDRIFYVSPYFQEYISHTKTELCGNHWSILFNEEEQNKIKNHFSKYSDQLLLPDVRLKNENSIEIEFDICISRLFIKDMFVYICQFKNESYIKKLEKMVVESEKLILAAQLSAGLVHEIRNPLTSLKGFLQLVQSGVQQKEEYYRVMIGEIDKLEKITTELLQMAKPLKKQMKMEYVKELIEDVAFMLDTQSSFKDVNLEIKCDPTIQIVCNASQIKQVLINLILNAAEAMTNRGTIYLHTYIKNQFVIMDIIDEGEGITPEVINELYEPFFTTKEQGTGLGLIITQHLLDLHQAKLEVRPNKQKGSTFTILLPLSNPS